ncbi:hemolysin family protein [Eubacteriales bacterium OttesenSCG-928-N13]|nr:hemolysin family protein [Eubacteriales bacterium OttesenSCG-928-N13]
MDGDSIPLLLLLFLCFLLSAFFSASEMSLLAMNRVRMKNNADNGNARAKRVMFLSAHFEQTLTTILIGNNIANIVSAALVTLLVTRMWGQGAVAWATIVVTLIVFFFCELFPKSIAKQRSEDVAMWCGGLLVFFMRILKPVAYLFTAWSNLLKRVFKAPDDPSFTEEEIQGIIETIEDEGVLEPQEQELVQSAFEFSSIEAQDVLIPIDRVVALSITASAKQITDTLRDNHFSRFPVFDARRTHVIGMLQANRFYSVQLRGQYKNLRTLLLPLRSYPKTMHIDDLMQELNARRTHMALIHDDDGSTLGIVTMEDILEELVGEIYDEDDVMPPEQAEQMDQAEPILSGEVGG